MAYVPYCVESRRGILRGRWRKIQVGGIGSVDCAAICSAGVDTVARKQVPSRITVVCYSLWFWQQGGRSHGSELRCVQLSEWRLSVRVLCCDCYFVCMNVSVFLIVVLGMTNRYRWRSEVMGRTRRRISLTLWMLFLCVMGAVSTVREIHGEFTALNASRIMVR